MRFVFLPPLAVALLCMTLAPGVFADEGASAPSEAGSRRQVDDLIHSFKDAKRRATPGMIQQAIGLSISYGAPAYNRGDRTGCARFYTQTAESLVAAFSEKDAATPQARQSLDDLQFALDRSRAYNDPDRSAWSLRFAFDKNQLACVLSSQRTQALIAMGEEYFKRGQIEESRDALQSAVTSLGDLDGQSVDAIPVACRYAPLALANALFAQQKFKDASSAILRGLTYVPQWPVLELDLKSWYHDTADYNVVLQTLESNAKADPKDIDLQFLLGYQYWFTGRKVDAKEQFEQTLKLDPNHPGAKLFLESRTRRPGDVTEKPKA